MRLHPSPLLAAAAIAIALPAPFILALEDTSDLGRNVLKWIHEADGGFVYPGQAFQADPETGVMGMFATEDIPKGTVLCQVPWDLILKSDDEDEEGQMCCGTVKAVAREMKKAEASEYAPYVQYLNAMPSNEVPSAWSDAGQQLLREIVGGHVTDPIIPPEEPTEWLSFDWYGRCRGSRADELAAKAALIVVQRSDDHIMIPGYDMYNHRNGNYLNTVVTTKHGDKHTTVASRDISKGEQIHNSYNRCKECSGRRTGYGTAEILRDYGFLEEYPQEWHFFGDEMQFELDVNPNDNGFKLKWTRGKLPNNDDRPGSITGLKRQIRRLRQLKNVNYKDGKPDSMPQDEWDTCWEFVKGNIQAMTVAVQSLEAIEAGIVKDNLMKRIQSDIKVSDFDEDKPHYDELGWEFDDLDYVSPTCNNREIMKFHDHTVVEEIKTHYQNLNFAIHPETMDVVMDLDDIVQISSNYRPQYHEYVTHAAARFLPSIKRVIFIGGGDSMLLHEVLKYPDLELVVGLELDQIVTRKCFKYFRSSPHFEDPRVEWWFGDATKSLLLLSEEYWQSFDLVLVDLSETVMSLSVTKELDVFDALALLLKHEGVMVKNELYMEPISKVFDYSMDILYESPVICSQVLAFGSNKVDFIHDTVYDHGIETLLYKNMHDPDTRHNFTHDYRINNATKQEKCGPLAEREKLAEQSKSAGVVEIVEAEHVKVALDESLATIFLDIIKANGLNPIEDPIFEAGQLVIGMKEGYVIARMFPNQKYCNLDVHLWGSFHKLKILRKSLTDALKSDRVSQFKIVVGGMYGSATWDKDREIIGPKIVQTRNCDIPSYEEAEKDISEELISSAFEEAMGLLPGEEMTAVVICKDVEKCLAAQLLEQHKEVRKIVKLSDCTGDAMDVQYSCEIDVTIQLKKKLGKDKADILIVDSSASKKMVQVMNSILARDEYRQSVITHENLFMVWTMDAEKEEYQRNFLDRYRKQHNWDPQARTELWMQVGTKALEFGFLKTDDKQIYYKIPAMEERLKAKFADEKNVEIELRGIYGGLFEYKPYYTPNEFLQSDYESQDGYDQYFEQKPLARHTVFQLEEESKKTFDFSAASLNFALSKALENITFQCTTKTTFTDIGEGVVISCMNALEGSVFLVWDGRKHVDISFYALGDPKGEADVFINSFLQHAGKKLAVALRDDMPRGINRVINFAEDLRTPEQLASFYENLHNPNSEDGDDDNDDDNDEGDFEDEEDSKEDIDPSRSEL